MNKKIDAQIKKDLEKWESLPLLDIINHPNSKTYIVSDFWIFTINIDFEKEDFQIHENLIKERKVDFIS